MIRRQDKTSKHSINILVLTMIKIEYTYVCTYKKCYNLYIISRTSQIQTEDLPPLKRN